MAAAMTSIGYPVDSIPMEIPAMMFVAGPVWEASAMNFTGRYRDSV